METPPSNLPVGTIVVQAWNSNGRSGRNRLVKLANDPFTAANGRPTRSVSYWGFIDRMKAIPSESEFVESIRRDAIVPHTFAIWDNSADHEGIIEIESQPD